MSLVPLRSRAMMNGDALVVSDSGRFFAADPSFLERLIARLAKRPINARKNRAWLGASSMKYPLLLGLMIEVGAANPLPVAKPTGPWVVDFEKASCIASHDYDLAGTQVVIGVEAIPTIDDTKIYFQVPGKVSTYRFEDADVLAGGRKIKDNSIMGEPVADAGHARYSTGLEADEFRALLADNSISIRSGVVKGTFPLPSLNAVNQQLANCTAQMLEGLGFSRDAQSKIATYPKVSMQPGPIVMSGYPDAALARGAIGWVRIAVDVDDAGTASNCRVIRSSGHRDLDADACSVFRTRARLLPARDQQGRRVPSIYVRDINYVLAG